VRQHSQSQFGKASFPGFDHGSVVRPLGRCNPVRPVPQESIAAAPGPKEQT
jgi:hypothetical protein